MRSLRFLCLLVALTAAAAASLELERLTIRVTPAIAVSATDVRIVVTVRREPADDVFCLTVDGEAFYRRSEVAADRVQHVVTWHIPDGRYDVVAELLDRNRRVVERISRVLVIGTEGSQG